MRIEDTVIEGLKIIHLNKLDDNRGSFTKTYNYDFFIENGLRTDFKESYFSISNKDVIRGMHFQTPPSSHVKGVYVNQGGIIDVVLDIRKESKTFGQHFCIEVSALHPKLIYIPIGCAHGFHSLQDNTIVSYMQTSVYDKDCDQGIKWDSFGMNWQVTRPVISNRDQAFDVFKKFKTPFV